MLKRILAGLLSCICMTVAFSSCAETKSPVERDQSAVTVSLPYSFDKEVNPFYADNEGDKAIMSLLFETYFGENGIASVEIIGDEQSGYSVTVDIAQGVKFSNSRNVTAADLIYAIQLVCDPTYDGGYTALSQSSLVGLDEYRRGKEAAIAGVQKISTFSLQLQFSSAEDYESLLDLPIVNAAEYGSFVFGKAAFDDLMAIHAKCVGTGALSVNGRLESSKTAIGLEANKFGQKNPYKHKNFTVLKIADGDVGINIKMRQISAGFVLDEDLAKSQAKTYDLHLLQLQNGYLLCNKRVNIPDNCTVAKALSLLLQQI